MTQGPAPPAHGPPPIDLGPRPPHAPPPPPRGMAPGFPHRPMGPGAALPILMDNSHNLPLARHTAAPLLQMCPSKNPTSLLSRPICAVVLRSELATGGLDIPDLMFSSIMLGVWQLVDVLPYGMQKCNGSGGLIAQTGLDPMRRLWRPANAALWHERSAPAAGTPRAPWTPPLHLWQPTSRHLYACKCIDRFHPPDCIALLLRTL